MHKPSTFDRPHSGNIVPWLLLTVVLLGVGIYTFRSNIADILKPPSQIVQVPASVAVASTAVGITVTSSSVMHKISQVSRIEAVEMKISTVVTVKKDGTALKFWQDAQKAVLIGEGTVTAGINLSELKPSDVVVSADGKKVQIKLPTAEILTTNLQRTETYDTQTGLFGTINIDPKLLDQARAETRGKLQATACESNVLQQATDSSKRQMENLITMMGLEAEVTSTPPAPCPANVVE